MGFKTISTSWCHMNEAWSQSFHVWSVIGTGISLGLNCHALLITDITDIGECRHQEVGGSHSPPTQILQMHHTKTIRSFQYPMLVGGHRAGQKPPTNDTQRDSLINWINTMKTITARPVRTIDWYQTLHRESAQTEQYFSVDTSKKGTSLIKKFSNGNL